ncbi:MAG: hypothetical protein IPH15_14965 [Comamonadaceae bacterium]|nr:hypothetical protein [Comamonadaceae bacterium]
MKVFLVAAVLGIQGVALYLNNPWRSWDAWTWIPWKDAPYLPIELHKEGIDPESHLCDHCRANLFFGRTAVPRLVALDQHLDI